MGKNALEVSESPAIIKWHTMEGEVFENPIETTFFLNNITSTSTPPKLQIILPLPSDSLTTFFSYNIMTISNSTKNKKCYTPTLNVQYLPDRLLSTIVKCIPLLVKHAQGMGNIPSYRSIYLCKMTGNPPRQRGFCHIVAIIVLLCNDIINTTRTTLLLVYHGDKFQNGGR